MAEKFTIAGHRIKRGERRRLVIGVAKLYDFTGMNLPVEVIRGEEGKVVLFVSAAIHGDEINGVEIIKRLLNHPAMAHIRGTLIAVPIVNVFGFNTKSRYLPDRRDLNRCFPGNAEGSLGSQLAYTFMQEIVMKCTHGIDLHTGAIHRNNLPQLRGDMEDPATRKLAEAFHVPVMINSATRDGSLREAARAVGVKTLLYEGGEALRFNEEIISVGLEGILGLMQSIGMLPESVKLNKNNDMSGFYARSSHWVRAPHSGMLTVLRCLGETVREGEVLGVISDPFGEYRFELIAAHAGIIIGQTMLPLVNDGDACFHIASAEDSKLSLEVTPPETLVSAKLDTFVS